MTKRVMGSVRAELLKMKHTFLIPFHVAVPVIIAGFMLFYYRGTIGNPMGQTMAYFELIGIGLPFVVSIVCAGNIGLEEQNHFQVFLGNYKVKGKGFVVKGVVLFGMGVLAIFGAAVLFAAGYHFLLGKEGIGMRLCGVSGKGCGLQDHLYLGGRRARGLHPPRLSCRKKQPPSFRKGSVTDV